MSNPDSHDQEFRDLLDPQMRAYLDELASASRARRAEFSAVLAITPRLLHEYADGDKLIGWDLVPGASGGYRYVLTGSTKRPHSWESAPRRDPNFPAPNARFAASSFPVTIEALGVVASGKHDGKKPPEPEPTPGDFRWDPPALTSPIVRTPTNAAPSIARGSGQDLRLAGFEIDRAIGQVEGYNDVLVEDFRIVGGTYNSNGHITPRENTGTFFIQNGRIELTRQGDALTVRWRQPKMYVVNTYIEVISGDDVIHSDCWQSQEGIIGELGYDRVTMKTDYQGIFQSNEPQNQGPARSKIDRTIISRLLFLPQDGGSFPATWFFKAFPPRPNADPVGVTEMYDVWAPLQNILAHVYPNGHTWRDWAGAPNAYGCFLESRVHPKLGRSVPFARFSTSADKVPAGRPLAGQTCGDCGVRGDGGIWCYETVAPTSEILALAGSVGV